MNDENESAAKAPEDRTPEILSFRATIVLTKHAAGRPTLDDLEGALRKIGVRFVMPADVGGSVVISVNDQ